MSCDGAPKLPQSLYPPSDWVACNNKAVDCTDRSADHPIGLDTGFVERLIGTRLVSARRAAALQNENDLTGKLVS